MTSYLDFLAEVANNNNREWFHANKARYEALRAEWLGELDTLIGAMSQWEPRLARLTGRDCAYRIYRDTRFSADKRPYKTYASANIGPHGRKTDHASYYVQFGYPEQESGLYGGLWCPDATMLRKIRRAIVDNADEWNEIVSDPTLVSLYPQWVGRTLKTIPKGYDRNDPMAPYLRLCDIGKFSPVDHKLLASDEWPYAVADRLRPLKPLIDFINYSIDE